MRTSPTPRAERIVPPQILVDRRPSHGLAFWRTPWDLVVTTVLKQLPGIYIGLTCLMLFAGVLSFCVGCWRAIHAPYELDNTEGHVMWQAANVTHLEKAFGHIEIPFTYPPIYPYVCHLVERFTHDLLSAGRWVSFLSALGIMLIIGVQTWLSIPRRWRFSARAGAAGMAGMLGASLSTMTWARLMRVDLLGLFFTFAGLLLFLMGGKRSALHYIAMVSFVLAIFTKQTNLAAPAACLMIALCVDWRHALRLVGFGILCGSAGLIALIVPTHGNVLRHWFVYNWNPFSVPFMLYAIYLNMSQVVPLAAIALALPCVVAVRLARFHRGGILLATRRWLLRSPTQLAIGLSCLHLLFALLMSLTCGKTGSNKNYFLEWNLACCLPVAFVITFLLQNWKVKKARLAETAVLLLLLLYASGGFILFAKALRSGAVDYQREQNTIGVMETLRRIPGPVYSESTTVLMKTGKQIFAEPFMITTLANTGTWDQREFVRKISSKFFSAIIVTSSLDNRGRFTPEVADAIRQNYGVDQVYGFYVVYIPKAADDTHQTGMSHPARL